VESSSAPRRRVVLGVTGSIAAYKAGEIIRLFRKSGVDVHVVMTPSARHFITPLTLGTLSGNPVTVDMFGSETGGAYMEWGGEPSIRHIQASRASDLIVVAPATGNLLGKIAHGIADEPLSTAILASSVRVLIAPAMNTRMWENPAVRANVDLLRKRGYLFVDPEEGDLACGEFGRGKMAEPSVIVDAALRLLGPARADLPRVLVTAGRTEEALDPVRFLSNHSSGKMGFAIAAAARDLGYPVTLVHGAVSAAPPRGVDRIEARSAAQMLRELTRLSPSHPILIMAAAVADYRPSAVSKGKIASGEKALTLKLTPTPDILASIAPGRKGLITVGFALETERGRERARAKLLRKGCDMIVLNNPIRKGSEFGGDTNEVVFLHADGREESLPILMKEEVGREIMRRIEGMGTTAKSRGRKKR
jgi:phosphopantothenoylcysteine decarboxylase / phosphopantothenate---cysteine ligase